MRLVPRGKAPSAKVVALLALALAAVALVACGGDDSTGGEGGDGTTAEAGDNGSGAGGTLKFEVDPGGATAYTTTEASVEAGKVKIELENPQPNAHDVAIDDSKGKRVAQTYGTLEASTSTTANLEPGTYTFYCTTPGHREEGMEGELTVQ